MNIFDKIGKGTVSVEDFDKLILETMASEIEKRRRITRPNKKSPGITTQ